jgi:3-hydroxymyristoyl/3-hydroxydecanoyl-(acyl carrier protein) dehydratase
VDERTGTLCADLTTTFCIAENHPSLPGHFPGSPTVPGALLLAEGLRRLELVLDRPIRCRRIDSAKFLQPVAGGAHITVTLATTGRNSIVDFRVRDALVAQVVLSIDTSAAS